MVGAESDWVISDRGFARYPKLRPGKYTFEVRSANADGVWQQEPLQLPITIQTPFYQTTWFYLLCILVVAGMVGAWFQYRLNQALKLERMRVKISSDLHDDVGSMLSGLAMQSEILGLNAQGKDKDRLQRIAETSRNAMARMRDTVWAIDARKDRLENLIDRMREHAEECLTPKDVQFSIQINGLENKLSLPSIIRQCVYLIYKEAITNITKHSNADRVRVVLSKKGKGLEMEICDNGKVEEKSYKPSGMGLSNMTMRAKQVHGDVRIETKDGFCIFLNVPSLKVKE
jgi:signal transduction histidine kinase